MNISTDEILSGLTLQQREAVTHRDGPMLVVAGAGSGKTRVVTRRIAYLLANGVWPSQILAMTFTNKAAREMRERIEMLTGGESPRNIGTFHSCCARFLRRDLEKLNDGRDGNFTIYDTGEQQTMVKQVLKESRLELPMDMNYKGLAALISSAKSQRMDVLQLALRDQYDEPEMLAAAAEKYEERMRKCNAVDFDDLLYLTARLLEENPTLRDVYQHQFRYLMIDEYQDTNHLQYELMRLLTGREHNVHVTGDPDQSIYSWRGADYSNIMNFTKDYPEAKVVRLEQNYRSTKTILNAANEVISNNVNRMDKTLFTENDGGCLVKDVSVGNDFMEGAWLARRIMQLRAEGESLKDMAVFYRTNAQSRQLEEAMINGGIPYQLLGGLRFYERKEVKDMLAFLRLRVNHCDLVSLERVAECYGKGIGPKTLANIVVKANEIPMPVLDFLASDDFEKMYGRTTQRQRDFAKFCHGLREIPLKPVGESVGKMLEYSGLLDSYSSDVNSEDRQDNLKGLVQKAVIYETDNPEAGLDEYLEEVALVADVDAHDPNSDTVKMMTLHSSKGLEFPFVFITGVEEGYLPHVNSSEDEKAIEEERRLFYVGITRAQRELVLLHAQMRTTWEGAMPKEPSRFIEEIPSECIKQLFFGTHRRHGGYDDDGMRTIWR